MLDDRKLSVLRAIVEDYVSTNEPVGSKALSDRHTLGVSPATIRNDMVALEEDGYIAQPHTSAGRIPTDKGYRLFVDRLSTVKPLSGAERRAIETFLGGAVDLDEIVGRTVRLLAQLTRQVAVVQYPSLTRSSVQHVELVPLGRQRVMMVLITDTGRVEQRVIDGLEGVGEEAVDSLRQMLNRALVGKWLTDVPFAVEDLPAQVPPDDRALAVAVLSVLLESLVERHDEKIVLGGTSNLAAMDFSASLRGVLEALEENVVLLRLLGEMGDASSMLTVRIGAENSHEGLRTTSIVSADYGIGDQPLAKIGVVGPTRMDYPGTMGAVRAVARYLGQILAGQ
ncbi:heat-inducible transcriptional repressor HrcA [Streptomonospora sediminis]